SFCFFFQAEDGIRDDLVTGVQTCALPILGREIGDDSTDQLGIPALRRLIPDLADRDLFVCGPPAMIAAVSRRARRIGVPRARIRSEERRVGKEWRPRAVTDHEGERAV